jgi:tetratricopeptide (TPR) repeat protein
LGKSAKTLFAMSMAIGALCGITSSAHAALIVLGNELGRECYVEAEALSSRVTADGARAALSRVPQAIQTCSHALASMTMSRRDIAATYNNRGLLLFARASYDAALRDFERGIDYMGDVGELHANRGAALLALGRWPQSIDSLSKGIELESAEVAKVYYNRAQAYEELGDAKKAYLDYRQASALKPEWEMPRLQLTRFTVRSKAIKE